VRNRNKERKKEVTVGDKVERGKQKGTMTE
jgi:hypothetical protein